MSISTKLVLVGIIELLYQTRNHLPSGMPPGWDHYPSLLHKPLALSWGWFRPLGDVWQCPDTFLVFTTGVWWIEARDDAKQPMMHRTGGTPNNYLVQNVNRSKLRNIGLSHCWPSAFFMHKECESLAQAMGGWTDYCLLRAQKREVQGSIPAGFTHATLLGLDQVLWESCGP